MHLRGRPSYANITSTLALIVAIGGGTAWAATHHHYLITSTGQVKPTILKKLQSHDGTNGVNGAKGARGATGPTGATGLAGIVTATNTSVTLSATQATVVQVTAPLSGNLLVLGQVAGRKTNPQSDGALACGVVDLTAAPGTPLGSASAPFPKETLQNSFDRCLRAGTGCGAKGRHDRGRVRGRKRWLLGAGGEHRADPHGVARRAHGGPASRPTAWPGVTPMAGARAPREAAVTRRRGWPATTPRQTAGVTARGRARATGRK